MVPSLFRGRRAKVGYSEREGFGGGIRVAMFRYHLLIMDGCDTAAGYYDSKQVSYTTQCFNGRVDALVDD